MKLVDILARELAEWPVKEGERNKESDYCAQSDTTSQVFFCGRHGEIFLTERADETSEVRVTRSEWQAAVDALNTPKVVEWPELSETVEVIKGPAEWSDEQIGMIGRKGKVRSIFKNDCDQKIVAIELSSGECKCFIIECIKPVRTAEQEAAEEREKAIADMMQHGVDAGDATIEYSCAALYDAGYRKQVLK